MKRMFFVLFMMVTSSLQAQNEYPTKAVRVIVPFAAGGATDLITRMVTARLSENMGRQFYVENRGGANGAVGTDVAAKAPADGYTLVMGTVGTHGINFSLYDKPLYDPVKDFTALTRVAVLPSMILVHHALPVNNMKELIEHARAHPGKLAYGSAGSLLHLTGALMASMAGIDMLHVPFKGVGPQMSAISNNDVQVAISPVFSALPILKTGKARALAVTSAQRSSAAPGYPTVAESGLPGYDAVSWYGLFTTAGTPQPVVSRLSAEIRKVLATPQFKEQLHSQGAEPVSDTPEEFAAIVRADVVKWAKIVKDTGAKAD
jgi:tripartite-type tricarboxylate transporter receptor subunit TctC